MILHLVKPIYRGPLVFMNFAVHSHTKTDLDKDKKYVLHIIYKNNICDRTKKEVQCLLYQRL